MVGMTLLLLLLLSSSLAEIMGRVLFRRRADRSHRDEVVLADSVMAFIWFVWFCVTGILIVDWRFGFGGFALIAFLFLANNLSEI